MLKEELTLPAKELERRHRLSLKTVVVYAGTLEWPTQRPVAGRSRPRARPVALMLALAHQIQDAIDRGEVRDRAAVARALGFTRARLTYLLDLTLLAPDIQDQLLALEAVGDTEPTSERALRDVARSGSWAEQLVAWAGAASRFDGTQ